MLRAIPCSNIGTGSGTRQGQESAVERAAERRNLARDGLTDTQSQVKRATAEIQRTKNRVTQSESATERKELLLHLVYRLPVLVLLLSLASS